ncbi:MAG TPA: sulfate ABC transporter ATP-binding protein [Candidatus Baltobacteraceae bacterium]|jgi:sulfate transport system ATP-binding protein|nr:sulfate ABC transporter ATP-binding protein [Candidatus Baltobacteraceae bacterium]
MVHIENVTRRFTTLSAVRNVTLRVESGSLVALLGPSGCGKTTLLRMIAGLEQCDAGRIVVEGKDVTRRPVTEREIGFVFQNYALFPHLNVRENVAFGLRVRRKSGPEIAARVDEMLELVGLSNFGDRHPAQLSGGQRQRVALARALALSPSILLLDEPFAALDVHVRKDLRTWLRSLHDKTHVTTLLVTHDPEEAMEIADHIALMRDGHIEQFGKPRDLYDEPSSLFAMRFLGPVSTLKSRHGQELHARPHHLRVEPSPFPGAHDAVLIRAQQRGGAMHFDLRLADGHQISAEVPLAFSQAHDLTSQSAVFVAPVEFRTFDIAPHSLTLETVCA